MPRPVPPRHPMRRREATNGNAGGLVDRDLFRLSRLRVRWFRRDKKTRMGRFGGGWQWSVGVQVGRRTAIVNLLVGYLRITWGERKA